jgi:hypothetical protein
LITERNFLFFLASTRGYDGLSPFGTPYNRSCATYPPGIQANLSSGRWKTNYLIGVLICLFV